MKIGAMESQDKPREKLESRGAESLSTAELVAVILGSGTRGCDIMSIGKRVEALMLQHRQTLSLIDLQGVAGIGTAKACQLMAALEMGRRLYAARGARIASYRDVVPLLEEYRHKKQEYFVVLTLDGAGCLIERRVITIGTLNASLVHPREVFADALCDRAASIIAAHNHPSGSLEPSPEDKAITERLRQGGELLGIQFLDHIIISPQGEVSLKELGFM